MAQLLVELLPVLIGVCLGVIGRTVLLNDHVVKGLEVVALSIQPKLKSLLLLFMLRFHVFNALFTLLSHSVNLSHMLKLKTLCIHLLLLQSALPFHIDECFCLLSLTHALLDTSLQLFALYLPLEQLLALFNENFVNRELQLLDEAVFVIHQAR
jgi:hypothetical protein